MTYIGCVIGSYLRKVLEVAITENVMQFATKPNTQSNDNRAVMNTPSPTWKRFWKSLQNRTTTSREFSIKPPFQSLGDNDMVNAGSAKRSEKWNVRNTSTCKYCGDNFGITK